MTAPAPGPVVTPPTPKDWAPYGNSSTSPVASDGARCPVSGAAGGWTTGRTISDLWSYEDSVGVWVLVDDIGWKRLSPASDSGHTHMTLLAGVATHDNLPVDFHEDGDGQIDQLIV
jgi:hypothetical protein